MRTENKRQPAYNDLSLMPFGKYKGEPLQDIPASYLQWLWRDGIRDFSRNTTEGKDTPISVREKILLGNYIWNSQNALEEETGESL